MSVVIVIFEWLQVIALLGLFAVLIWLVFTVLSIKNAAMRDAKRIYEPPTRAVKSLIGTGKGIAQQETVRACHMAASVKDAAGAVKETAGEVKTLVDTIRFSDLKPMLANIQNILKLLSLAGKLTQAAAVRQGPGADV